MDDMQDMTGHQNKIRRISLNLDDATNDTADTAARSVQLSQIRTLARFGTSSQLLSFKLFKHLRVLGVEISGWPNSDPSLDFTGIRHLFQLRFLKIVANGYHVVLPSKIGDLQQLETFDIGNEVDPFRPTRLPKLPSDIFNLSRLLHLAVPGYVILPDRIGNMKSLRTLGQFGLGNSLDSIKGLRELTNLTNLEISCGNHYSKSGYETAVRCWEVVHALENLCNLRHLHIYSRNDLVRSCFDVWRSVPAYLFHLQSFHANYVSCFSRVPKWFGQLHSIYDLVLTVQEVLEDDVGILSQLPSLIHLFLHIRRAPEAKIIIPGGSGLFPVLKHFRIICGRISYLTFEVETMPKLERLELYFNAEGWDRYGAVPAGIEHLPSLKEISVDIGGIGANESDRRAAESALRDTADMHPRRPVANIKVDNGAKWVVDEPEEEEGNGGSSSSST
jgi:hypothetical protein